MSVIISHSSALEYLRAVPPQVGAYVRTKHELPLPEASTSPSELARLDLARLGIRQQPCHVLVAKGRTRVKSRMARCHVSSAKALPAGSMLAVAPDAYVCGPELVFQQMASAVSELGLIVLGFELCGRYSQFAPLVSGFYDRPALSCVRDLQRIVEGLGHASGIRRARRALRWVCDGSRSPMETVVSCALLLPGDMGGCSLVTPRLNYRVSLDDVAGRITGTRSCALDVAWPDQHVGVEYDSDAFHRDRERDRRRREALAHMGWSIFVINLDEIRSYQGLAEKIDLFSGRIPVQQGTPAASERDRRRLVDRLLRATRFGLGLNGALFGVDVGPGRVVVHL